MYATSLLAMSGLLSFAAAVPMAGHQHHQHHKARALVWETAYEEVIVTVPVTKTVWIEPGETPPPAPSYAHPPPAAPAAPAPPASQQHPDPPAYSPPPAPVSSSAPPAYTPPAPSSSAPAYVPPAPSSSSSSSSPAYVPPPAPSPTSAYTPPAAPPAPEAPSSSAPAPASTPEAAPSSDGQSYGGAGPVVADKLTAHSGVSSGMAGPGKAYTGDLTWFEVGMGACGHVSVSTDPMVAISHTIFDAYTPAGNANNNPLCGSTVLITGKDGSRYRASIQDRCVSCAPADLDLSQSLFNTITSNGDGRVGGMSWEFE